jgi:hypothetical protein
MHADRRYELPDGIQAEKMWGLLYMLICGLTPHVFTCFSRHLGDHPSSAAIAASPARLGCLSDRYTVWRRALQHRFDRSEGLSW